MRILAFSDVRRWDGYERVVDEVKPDVVCLAGDLTSDGFAAFWDVALALIPDYRRELEEKLRELGVWFQWRGVAGLVFSPPPHVDVGAVTRIFMTLEEKYRNTKEFHENRKRIHVDKFYSFLEYAGKVSKVLVVRGDHDYDFEGDYDINRINATPGCSEISGRLVEVGGVRFLGVGFEEVRSVRKLRSIVEEYRGRVDVVVAHNELWKTKFLGELRPRLIIRGHSGRGVYLVNGVPAVFTAGGTKYAVIDLEPDRMRIALYDYQGKPIKPETWVKSSRDRSHEWLKPYAGDEHIVVDP